MKRHHIAASVLTALVVFTAVGFLVFGGTNDKSGAASRDKHGHATTTSTTTVEEGTINDTEVQAYVREQVTIKTVSFKCTELVAMLLGSAQQRGGRAFGCGLRKSRTGAGEADKASQQSGIHQ